MRRLALLLCLLGLAACEPAATPKRAAPDDVGADGHDAETIAALPERAREGVFLRAIRDAGLPCQDVVTSVRDPGVPPTWRAQCDDGSVHRLRLDGEGMVVVTSRPGR